MGAIAKAPAIQLKTKPKVPMKSMHWSAIPARLVEKTIFAKMDFNAVDLNFGEIENLFCAKVTAKASGDGDKDKAKSKTVSLIDQKRTQNVSIFLNTIKKTPEEIKKMTKDLEFETSDSVLRLVESLPTPEEMMKVNTYLKEGGDIKVLADPEFFFTVIDKLSFNKERLESYYFVLTFADKKHELTTKLNKLTIGIKAFKESKKLNKLIEYVLAVGNFMNGGANKPLAKGFRIESLAKLVDTKTFDNSSTMLHYVLRVLEVKAPEVLDLNKELISVGECAKINCESLKSDLGDLSINLTRTETTIKTVMEKASDDLPFKKKVSDQIEGLKKTYVDLQTSFDSAMKSFREMEVMYKGTVSEDEPQEFFNNMNRFLDSFTNVRTELELTKVKKEKAAQKEDKMRSKLKDEIHKGIKLRPVEESKKKEKEKEKILSPRSKQGKLTSEMAAVGLIASKAALQMKLRAKQQQKKGAEKGSQIKQGPSELDKLLSQFSK